MSDQDSAIDRIHRAASQRGFDPEAFLFVLDVLNLITLDTTLREGVKKHVTALDLSHRLCQVAVSEFGATAVEQLRSWNIETTNDFGTIVYSLVELGLVGNQEGESVDDFRELFELDVKISTLLDQQHVAPRPKFYQYRLSSMLVITTILAFVFAGYAKEKFVGSVIAVYFAWLTTIALGCWWLTFRDRKTSWLPGAVVGGLLLAAALVVFRALFVR